MINLAEAILMGAFATLFMDLASLYLAKSKLIRSPIGAELVGRWTLYMLRGKFVHKDINQTPALNHEKLAATIAHYLIGIVLAGIYLFLELKEPTIRHQVLMPLVFGIATVLLPWLWLYPSMGLGFLAWKAPKKSPYIVASLFNHTNFGIGMLLWVATLRRFML